MQVVILAAGLGKRLGSDEPKVLTKLNGRPLVSYVLDDVDRIQHAHKPIVVVGYKAENVKEVLGPKYSYVLQAEQLGTGHAVAVTKDFVSAPHTLVLYGDMPFVANGGFLEKLIESHETSGGVMTMATVKTSDFLGRLASLQDYGRIVRHPTQGHVLKIVEKKDLTENELGITELNPGLYVFESSWLFSNIEKLKNENAQKEYYLTDMVAQALAQGHRICDLSMESWQALGVNTTEQLILVENAIIEQGL